MATIEGRLDELIVESEDLQSDALRASSDAVADLRDLGAERRGQEVDADAVDRFNVGRRQLLAQLGGRLAAVGLVGGGVGAALAAALARPARADQRLDVQILQTASSLERLAVNTYGAALGLPFVKNGNKVLVKFAQTTMAQHDAHRQAFQVQTTALSGVVQDAPNARYADTVAKAQPTLKSMIDVINLAALLERVARDTYLADLAQLTDAPTKKLMASVLGVETQHLAILRAAAALVAAKAPQLIAIPVNAAALPAAAGTAGFSDGPIPAATMASPAQEGAL